jgi:hypothetical protein
MPKVSFLNPGMTLPRKLSFLQHQIEGEEGGVRYRLDNPHGREG